MDRSSVDDDRRDDDGEEPLGGSTGNESVLEVIRRKVGEAPQVSLDDEDPATAVAPVLDPQTEERGALPKGRGNYQLLGEIARGGMGVVLRGHDTDLGRDVALKVLNRDFAHRPDVLQRFVEEAQIGGQLQHPGIVPVYELGLMADERPYFTMKLVKGRTLATLLSERESPAVERRRMLDVFESVCQTMAYAHSRGVIHRDLKPANVMVGAFGEVQVVDWGLAKVMARGGTADERRARDRRAIETILTTVRSDGSGSGSDSLVGSVMGTPAYMPPEQAAGHVDRLDERSDVFSLGAILCEILTGAPPYEGDTEQVVAQAAHAELDAALARLEGCEADPDLVHLTRQCLTPAPLARPRNAGVLAERIRKHLESTEERALALQIEAAEAKVHAQEERRARRLTIALAASVLGIGLVGGGGYLWVQSERVARERAAAAREAGLLGDVNAALHEASLLAGKESFGDAVVALERAEALAEAGTGSEALSARIEAVRSDVRAAEAEAEERAALERRTRSLVAALDEIESGGSDVEGGGGTSLINWPAIDAAYAEVFASHGIDVDGSSPAEAAAALGRLGIVQELVPPLHWWIAARRETSKRAAVAARDEEDLAPALQLVEIAHLVDDDPLRADLREAMLNDDVDMLRVLARGNTAGQPPATLVLLAAALTLNKEYAEALDVLRNAVHRYPDDYYLRVSLLRTLYQRGYAGPDSAAEYLRHAQAAAAMRPDNLTLRSDALWILFARAVYEECRKDRGAARLSYRELVDEAELLRSRGAAIDRSDEDQVAWALRRLGEPERAVEHYRLMVAVHPDSRLLYQGLGSVLSELGRFPEAEAAFARAVANDPRSSESYQDLNVTRAKRLAMAGDGEAATDLLEAAASGDPSGRREAALNDIAWRLALVPRARLLGPWTPSSESEAEAADRALGALLDLALGMAERAVEAKPDATNWNTLGALRYRVGDPEGCREAMARSIELSGGRAVDWLFLAMAHHELGDDDLARSMLERADLWLRDHRAGGYPANYEALALRAEAEALLAGD